MKNEESLSQQDDLAKHPIERFEHVFFALACCCVIALFVAGYYQANLSRQGVETVKDNADHIELIDRLMMNLVNAETGVRGYILGREEIFLEPYEAALPTIQYDLEKVLDLAHDDENIDLRVKILKSLVQEHLKIFENHIRDTKQDRTISVDELEASKENFDLIRHEVGEAKLALTNYSNAFYYNVLTSQEVIKYSILLLSIIALGFLIWLFSAIQKQAKLKHELTKTLSEQNDKLEVAVNRRTSQLTRLATQLTRISEQEKQRLASELHDDMGASLTAAKMDAASIARFVRDTKDEKANKRTARLLSSLDHAISLKRRLTSDLLPPLLEQLGLHEALRSLGEDLSQDPEYNVSISIPEEQPGFDEETALSLFRITQEAMTNIRKYSQASEVNLSVELSPGKHTLTIRDNGIGFDPATVGERRYGLVSMRHRAQMNGAKLNIVTKPGGGTKIKVVTPI